MPQLKIEGQDGPKNEPKKATLGLTEDQEDKFAKERAKQEEEFARKTAAIDKAKSGEITGALEATNKKKEEDDRFNAAIEAKQAAAKPVPLTKTNNSPQSTKGGNMKVTGGDPVQPPTFLSMGIPTDIWNIGMGVFVAIYGFLRGKWKTKTDGMVDKKGKRAEQVFSALFDPTSAIVKSLPDLVERVNGKKSAPLTEDHLSQVHKADPTKQPPAGRGRLYEISEAFKGLTQSASDSKHKSDQQLPAKPIVFSHPLDPSKSPASTVSARATTKDSLDATRGEPSPRPASPSKLHRV